MRAVGNECAKVEMGAAGWDGARHGTGESDLPRRSRPPLRPAARTLAGARRSDKATTLAGANGFRLRRWAIDLLRTLPESAERYQQELRLQLALGGPLIAVKGYSSSEVGRVYKRAHVLCQEFGERPSSFARSSGTASSITSAGHSRLHAISHWRHSVSRSERAISIRSSSPTPDWASPSLCWASCHAHGSTSSKPFVSTPRPSTGC